MVVQTDLSSACTKLSPILMQIGFICIISSISGFEDTKGLICLTWLVTLATVNKLGVTYFAHFASPILHIIGMNMREPVCWAINKG